MTPALVEAHAFGAQFVLPLPISFYALGASAALIASFAILSLWSKPEGLSKSLVKETNLPFPLKLEILLKLFGLLIFALTLLIAFFGSPAAPENLSLFVFWIGLLLIFPYISVLVSGIWEKLDPFRFLSELALGKNYQPLLEFPPWLRYLPAILVYFAILYLELLSYGAGGIPYNIGLTLLLYLIVSVIGSGVFGVENWFCYGDFFSVFFRLCGLMAPLHLGEEKISVMAPGERLVSGRTRSFALLFFIFFILAATAYDGFRETAPWFVITTGNDFLVSWYSTISLSALLIAPCLFFLAYAVALYLMAKISRYEGGSKALMLRYAYSLVPIALAYNFAHYFTLILNEGQNLIPMLSDPLSRGWDLFGTATYTFRPDLISATTTWYIEVVAIVIGHIFATYIAHRIALEEFQTRKMIILAQLPMLILMVGYTSLGLWILSLPFGTS